MALLAITDVHWEAGGLPCISQWSSRSDLLDSELIYASVAIPLHKS